MKSIQLPAQSVPVIDEAEVVVIGGGTAGFVAAVAAARTGAKTILVERFGYLGGCTTAPYNTGIGWFGDSDGNSRGPSPFATRCSTACARGTR